MVPRSLVNTRGECVAAQSVSVAGDAGGGQRRTSHAVGGTGNFLVRDHPGHHGKPGDLRRAVRRCLLGAGAVRQEPHLSLEPGHSSNCGSDSIWFRSHVAAKSAHGSWQRQPASIQKKVARPYRRVGWNPADVRLLFDQPDCGNLDSCCLAAAGGQGFVCRESAIWQQFVKSVASDAAARIGAPNPSVVDTPIGEAT